MTQAHQTQQQAQLPTLDYLVMRCCERLHIPQETFWNIDYARQIELLAYELLRQREELHS